jgi:hypothetical protein
MKDRPQGPALTRRRFVAMVAAGSAALATSPLAAATAAPPAKRRSAAAAALPEAERKEFERQRKATLETLAVLRKHAMPPGTEMASVFRPLKPARGKD